MNRVNLFEAAFRGLPDTVVITDIYWYVLEFNHRGPLSSLRRGQNLKRLIPDCGDAPEGRLTAGERIYQRSTTPVRENGGHVGYVVYLADITREQQLLEQSRKRSEALKALTLAQQQANEELENYARETEALLGYVEQLRIARSIHDEAGHAMTELNMVSQMCLQLKERDPEQAGALIREGIGLCEAALRGREAGDVASLTELLQRFQSEKPFPVELVILGETEPAFAAALYGLIRDICEEAYSNTVSHSLADRMRVHLHMEPDALRLHVTDNGRFSGGLSKGFGLQTMEKRVAASGGSVAFETKQGQGFGILAEWRKEKHE